MRARQGCHSASARCRIARVSGPTASRLSALINAGCVHAKLGETDAAMDFLERVFALGFGKRDWIVNDPDYAILAPEPRFQQWLGRLK